MAQNDCGFCDQLYNCSAQVINAKDFYTFALKMLCEVAENTASGGGGGGGDVNLTEIGGVAVGAANALYVQPGTGAVFPISDNGGSITVDGTVAATQSGSWNVGVPAAATSIAKAEDSASADADVGVPAMAVQKLTPANSAGTDGDYEFLQMSAGALWTLRPDRSTTFNFTGNGQTVTLTDLSDIGGIIIYVSAVGSGITVAVSTSIDGTNFVATNTYSLSAGTFSTNITTQTGYYRVQILGGMSGVKAVRLATTAYGSGATTGTIVASPAFSGQFAAVTGSGTVNAGTQRVVLATDQAQLTNPFLVVGQVASDAPITSGPVTVGGRASDTVPSAVSTAGDAVNTWHGLRGEVVAALEPKAFGGLSANLQATLSNTFQTVKGSAGTLYGWYVYNPNTSVTYLQIFNSTNPTVGTTTPLLSLGIPASSGANVEFTNGIAFSTGITVAATTGATNSTAPSSSIQANLLYK